VVHGRHFRQLTKSPLGVMLSAFTVWEPAATNGTIYRQVSATLFRAVALILSRVKARSALAVVVAMS